MNNDNFLENKEDTNKITIYKIDEKNNYQIQG